jgi:hypothetical protein
VVVNYTAVQFGGSVTGNDAFWTTEVDPPERGDDGPIKMLVAMDIDGVLA